jgi:isopentenyl-diphosphate delta-isomerase
VECIHAGAEVVASGGVRSGVDVAKGIALGASMAGTALPMLGPATISSDEVARSLKAYIRALRISMFLTGSENIEVLKSAPIIIAGRSREYLESRGFDTRKFSILREMAR